MARDAALIDRLYTDIEWALAQGLPHSEVVRPLERLVRETEPLSLHGHYARRQLAEYLVRSEPFRAARLATEALRFHPDDRSYAALGMAHLVLGNFHAAERALRSAHGLSPHSPWHAHNLGHLLDVGLGRPREALPLLEMAHRGLPHEPEITSSLAHALLHLGEVQRAERTLLRALGGDHERTSTLLAEWAARLAGA